MHKHCFQFLLGQLKYPGEMKNKGYAIFFFGGGGGQIINNYWTRLSKISWFVSDEQINYLPKPKAEASNITDLRNTDKSRYFAITEFKDCFIIRPTSLCVMNIFGKRSDLSFFTQERPQEGEKRCFVYAWAEYYCGPTQGLTQLDDIAYEQTIICRQLFAGHVVGFRPIKRKKNAWNDKVHFGRCATGV